MKGPVLRGSPHQARRGPLDGSHARSEVRAPATGRAGRARGAALARAPGQLHIHGRAGAAGGCAQGGLRVWGVAQQRLAQGSHAGWAGAGAGPRAAAGAYLPRRRRGRQRLAGPWLCRDQLSRAWSGLSFSASSQECYVGVEWL